MNESQLLTAIERVGLNARSLFVLRRHIHIKSGNHLTLKMSFVVRFQFSFGGVSATDCCRARLVACRLFSILRDQRGRYTCMKKFYHVSEKTRH